MRVRPQLRDALAWRRDFRASTMAMRRSRRASRLPPASKPSSSSKRSAGCLFLSNVAPMLGLFGTVFGMIKAFNTIVELGRKTCRPSDLGRRYLGRTRHDLPGSVRGHPGCCGLSVLPEQGDADLDPLRGRAGRDDRALPPLVSCWSSDVAPESGATRGSIHCFSSGPCPVPDEAFAKASDPHPRSTAAMKRMDALQNRRRQDEHDAHDRHDLPTWSCSSC